MDSLDVLVLRVGRGGFVDLERLTQEFPRETGHLGHAMSEGYWGLVWTFPGVLLWIVRMALELFWAFPAFWAAHSLPPRPSPSSSLSSFLLWGALFSWGVGRGKFPIDDLASSCQSRPAMSDPLKQEIHDKLAEILNRCGHNPDKLNTEHTARLDALANRLASTDPESAKELLIIAGLTHLELLIRTA